MDALDDCEPIKELLWRCNLDFTAQVCQTQYKMTPTDATHETQ